MKIEFDLSITYTKRLHYIVIAKYVGLRKLLANGQNS